MWALQAKEGTSSMKSMRDHLECDHLFKWSCWHVLIDCSLHLQKYRWFEQMQKVVIDRRRGVCERMRLMFGTKTRRIWKSFEHATLLTRIYIFGAATQQKNYRSLGDVATAWRRERLKFFIQLAKSLTYNHSKMTSRRFSFIFGDR